MRQNSYLFMFPSILLSSCGSTAGEDLSDPTGYPDIGMAVAEATGDNFTRVYRKKCEQVEPFEKNEADQVWKCSFSFLSSGHEKTCEVLMTYQPDDHWAMWKPESVPDPKTKKPKSSLTCTA